MKKFTLLLIALLMISFLALSQRKLVVCQEGGVRSEFVVSSVDSIIFVGNEETPEEPDKPDTPVVPDTPVIPSEGSFVAKPFSISATETITFSPGNLQYHAANDEWRFAPNQTDYIGVSNSNINSTYNGWIDLFGWGTGNNPTNKSTGNADFVDWGVNKIGNSASNTWRTLTDDEWNYLRWERPNYDKLIGIAKVNGVNGLILLPDSWQCPAGIAFKSGCYDYHCTECFGNNQTISASDWAKLEASGAVFLPAAGSRNGYNIGYVQDVGNYWTSSESDSYAKAYLLYFNSNEVNLSNGSRYVGFSVRLVQGNEDVVKPDTPIVPSEGSFVAKPFSISATETITFSPGNLQYHAANDEWRFAPNQTDYIGVNNSNINSTYSGWIDLFGWGTGNNPTNKSIDDEDYQTFVDWGVNKIGNDFPNTWRTLTRYEWNYLRWERPNYDKLIGIAKVNGINGLILLPDSWQCPDGVTFKCGFSSNYNYHTISPSDWAKLEASGAVFLPAAGMRAGHDIYDVQDDGSYWTSTESDSFVGLLYFDSYEVNMSYYVRNFGRSVRLVKDN